MMKKDLQDINWDVTLNTLPIQQSWNMFKGILDAGIAKWVPMRGKKIAKAMWLNKKGLKLTRKKYDAWLLYKESHLHEDLVTYKRLLKETRKEIRTAKRNFEKKLADNIKEDSKSFYAYIRSKQKTKDRIGPLKDEHGTTVTTDEESANLLNEYFTSVFTKEDITVVPNAQPIYIGKDSDKLYVI